MNIYLLNSTAHGKSRTGKDHDLVSEILIDGHGSNLHEFLRRVVTEAVDAMPDTPGIARLLGRQPYTLA